MKVFIVLASILGLALCDKPLGGYGAPPLAAYASAGAPLGAYAAGGASVVVAGNTAVIGEGSEDESPIPGVPGEDYPIFNEVPETSFSCEGKVEGGYYADSEAECQAFHICGADGKGSLLKMSFLCHNGTIFSQELFTCDLWSNFNCADAEGLYAKNEELAAAREEASAALAAAAADSAAAAGSVSAAAAGAGYGAPVDAGYGAPADAGYGAPVAPLPAYFV